MSNKKDLTRIEDLGEFIHEMDADEEIPAEPDFLSDELPDLPTSEDESSFTTDFSTSDELNFGSSEETTTTEETTFDSPDFGSESETDFSPEEAPSFESNFENQDIPGVDFSADTPSDFETKDISGSDFDTSAFKLESAPEEQNEAPLFEEKTETKIEVKPVWEETPLETITPAPVYTPSEDFKTPENFEDLKKFSESSNFTGMATEGNPSFSVLVKNVRYIEDVNDITTLLKELNLLIDPEDQVKGRLMRGMLLIPRISEYAAIYLAHKLRRFDVDIQVGLSDEIHPPKHQETPETGIVSKFNLYQNQNHHFHFDDPKLELSQIIVAATPALEGYQVLRYLGVASEHKMLDSHIVEDESSDEVPRHYQELAQKLKAHALKAHSNAVVGLNYQLTPIPSEFGMGGHKYRLTCTGNLVWVNKL